MQRIYLTDISTIEEDVFERLMKLLPTERRSRAARIRKESERRLSVAAGILLGIALSDYLRGEKEEACRFVSLDKLRTEDLTALSDAETVSGAHGKPQLKKYPECFFNMSHSGDIAVLVWDDVPVGCDVQKLQACSDRLVQKACSTSEKEYVMKAQGEERAFRFSRVWCLKESVLKAIGIGIGTKLSEFETLDAEGNVHLNSERLEGAWELTERDLIPGYCFGICRKES